MGPCKVWVHLMHYLKSSGGLPNFEIPKITKYKVDQLCKKIAPKTQNTKKYFFLYFFTPPAIAVYKKSCYFFVFCVLLLPQGPA